MSLHRKSIRLSGYDYSDPGYYFVTICTQDRVPLFGKIKDGKMKLSRFGFIAKTEWRKMIHLRKNLRSDAFMIMPDHIHLIIRITSQASNHLALLRTGTPQACPDSTNNIGSLVCPSAPRAPSLPRDIAISNALHAYPSAPRTISMDARDPRTPNLSSTSNLSRGTPGVCPYGYGRRFGLSEPDTISSIIGLYKSYVTKRIFTMTKQRFKIWHRNFYERIIRNEYELFTTRLYIQRNPEVWWRKHGLH